MAGKAQLSGLGRLVHATFKKFSLEKKDIFSPCVINADHFQKEAEKVESYS